ncbi:hypothetical protein XENTR_v10022825 [Xenopus tropicalis]|uniref:Protein S100-G n=1 Tax=Xenopus tropicalis TaxID=8364 RepID=A0A1B8XWB9_XENTR|eukprot:XP_002942723.1 PREDICTED: protein S100-G-like [Xenopus tropicalis]
MASCPKSTLEKSICDLVETFRRYAGADGVLDPNELRNMAMKEFPTLCESDQKDSIMKDVFQQMDMDNDNKVSFKEFALFYCFISISLADLMYKCK